MKSIEGKYLKDVWLISFNFSFKKGLLYVAGQRKNLALSL